MWKKIGLLAAALLIVGASASLYAAATANPPLSTNYVVAVPSPANIIGITGITSTAAESSHVIKSTPGNLYSVYATNTTTTAGFLIVVNATTAPGTGALTGSTVLDCVPLPASGAASIDYAPAPPKVYSIGIVALLSSGANCFTFTTGSITGFISGSPQ